MLSETIWMSRNGYSEHQVEIALGIPRAKIRERLQAQKTLPDDGAYTEPDFELLWNKLSYLVEKKSATLQCNCGETLDLKEIREFPICPECEDALRYVYFRPFRAKPNRIRLPIHWTPIADVVRGEGEEYVECELLLLHKDKQGKQVQEFLSIAESKTEVRKLFIGKPPQELIDAYEAKKAKYLESIKGKSEQELIAEEKAALKQYLAKIGTAKDEINA